MRGPVIAASLLLIGAIFLLTHVPDEVAERVVPILGLNDYVDNILHAVAYAALALLFVSWSSSSRPRWAPLIALVLIMLIGAVDELTQPYFGRSRRWSDWASNVGGAAVALLCWLRFRRSRKTGFGGHASPPA